MNDEALLRLALQAIGDDEMTLVVEDAAQESGFRFSWYWTWPSSDGNKYASALAAEILFSSWPTRWPLAEMCRFDLLHPYGRCTCGAEGLCDWCRIPCPHGFARFDYCDACADIAEAAHAAEEKMMKSMASQRHSDDKSRGQ